MRIFSTRTHLSHTFHHFTNMCLPHGESCFIKPNLILDSSFPCCAWLCCHTHALPSCLCFFSILPPPCSYIMLVMSIMPALDSISRSDTNMYTLHASCYDSLPGQRSFPYFFFSCHISLPGIPFLHLSSLSSYLGTSHIHCTCPLTPMLFLVLLPDREYSLLLSS